MSYTLLTSIKYSLLYCFSSSIIFCFPNISDSSYVVPSVSPSTNILNILSSKSTFLSVYFHYTSGPLLSQCLFLTTSFILSFLYILFARTSTFLYYILSRPCTYFSVNDEDNSSFVWQFRNNYKIEYLWSEGFQGRWLVTLGGYLSLIESVICA